ncbi:MAG: DUF1080 domain-containing protein [Candidatus Omnitrophica bacterium]|nr:DUF1080 domain-containing protein [Candidatus Omnitrophota bacterium]
MRFNSYFLIVCSCLAFFPVTQAAAEPDSGFESIFDGKTLNGWKAADGRYWSVEDEAITAKSTADLPAERNHYLVWEGGQLGDFELKLQHRILSPNKVNGGFQFRSEMFDGEIPNDCRGYQVDNNTETDWLVRLYDEFGRHTLAWRGEKTVFDREGEKSTEIIEEATGEPWFQLDQWHEYHLVCRGPHLVLNVDGRIAAEVEDLDPAQQDFSGILALQLHSGPEMTVQFKDIQIKRLDSSTRE